MAASAMASAATTSRSASSKPSERSVGRWPTSAEERRAARRSPRPRRSRRSRRRGGPQRDADERQLAVAQAGLRGVEGEHLRQHGRQRRPVRQPPARPDGVAQRVDQPDARAARLADARQVRGHEHLRARLEVRAVGDGRRQPRPTVRMTRSAIASANGFGLADRSDSIEWVIASTPVAAVAAGGRPTVRAGSRMVQTGRSEGWPM